MPKIWPHETIRELLALAEAMGEAQAELGSEREAELFRFAIYSFRRQAKIGQDLAVAVEGNKVTVAKRKVPEVFIIQEDVA